MLTKIRGKLLTGQYRITRHALRRCDTRGITLDDIKHIVSMGEVVETYPNDTPYPSCLIMGYVRSKPLYVLCALGELAHIITVHWLDPKKWLDPNTRREKQA